MITQCQQYLIEKIKEASGNISVLTSIKKVELSQSVKLAAVIFGNETFTRSGSKKIFKINGGTTKRKKLFDRSATFNIILGDNKLESIDERVNQLLSAIEEGIYLDGNYTAITVKSMEWVDKDDSILNAKVGVNIEITFDGGLYKDSSNFAPMNGVDVSIERDSNGRYEEINQ